VDPDKDVDGLHPVNLGRLVMGASGPSVHTPASSSSWRQWRAGRGKHV